MFHYQPPIDTLTKTSTERYYWMCSQAVGDYVLDIGCGDAVTAVMLAREGHAVVGLDEAPSALETARDRVIAEQQSVQQRVELRRGEASSLPFADDTFDSVLLGDVLDRQINRVRPISEASRVLRTGGRLIVTAAYGARSDPAQRQPIRLDDLLDELASSAFSVAEITLIADHVCIAATLGKKRDAKVWRRALVAAEQRLLEQAEMLDALTAAAAEARALEDQARVVRAHERERADADSARVERLEAALAVATHERDSARGAARVADDGVARLDKAIEKIERERDAERIAAARERERNVSLAADHTALKGRERELENALQAHTEQIAERDKSLQELRNELGKIRTMTAAQEQELVGTRDLLRQREQMLTTTRETLEARQGELTAALNNLRVIERTVVSAHAQLRKQEVELTASEATLTESELRAERLANSLDAIRAGRAYRLMRVLWRLRRPFRRN